MERNLDQADNGGLWAEFQKMAMGALQTGAGALTNRLVNKNTAAQTSQNNPGTVSPAQAAAAPEKKWLPWAIGGGVVLVVLTVVAFIFNRK